MDNNMGEGNEWKERREIDSVRGVCICLDACPVKKRGGDVKRLRDCRSSFALSFAFAGVAQGRKPPSSSPFSPGCGHDSCLWKSFWGKVYDRWLEGLLRALEAISYAKYPANLLWDTSHHQDNSYSGKDFIGAWTLSLLNSLS
ncbi:hypothetical protein RJ639_045202 [Escallonia herrerae]|uniref:Uncharacterized protein n=1 Tax=Escallonia herrerae TaxID=1293975 RepID=A0AA88W7B3_9ASTE|nr:hypothetical protein RJ639_045202 [Escallonia herrerae]